MDQKSVERAARYLARRMRPFRSWILRAGKFVGKWVAIAAIISATVSFVLDGTEFINKKLPAAMAFLSKTVLLRETFRPVLVERVVKKDPGYANLCLEESQVLDLDNDGNATDLLVTFFPRGERATCPERNETADTIYVILKEVEWRGFWPRFAVVRTIARSDIGNFALGSGYKMTFEQLGPFLFGSVYGTDFGAYAIYGYSNGVLQSLGQYQPVGSLIENPQAQPRAQIGNRLLLYAEEGMKSFELTPEGRFVTRSLSAYDIVEMNNSALVIEDSEKMDTEFVTKLKETKSADAEAADANVRRYKLLSDPHQDCSSLTVFMNGEQIELKPRGEQEKICGADILISSGTVIMANVACDYQGFLETKHFPWGQVYDPSQPKHTISCPDDGDNDDSTFQYVLTIKLQ
jgi:hypothetical protein